jgi:hypothetical protein
MSYMNIPKTYLLISMIFLSIGLSAQIPSYLPTNGLLGWWPFDGNANDESGNGNNGNVDGATLATDRFGNTNKAYSFDGVTNNITCPNFTINSTAVTVSFWFNTNDIQRNQRMVEHDWEGFGSFSTSISPIPVVPGYPLGDIHDETNANYSLQASDPVVNNTWYHYVLSFDGLSHKLYINGILIAQELPVVLKTASRNLTFAGDPGYPFFGKIDDIGIWNRALTEREVFEVFNNCHVAIISHPTVKTANLAESAIFTLVSSDTTDTYQWQSNPLDFGWQNVIDNSQFVGRTADTLKVNNVSLSNHQQQFRVIASSGSCSDTSNVAILIITDTCIVTVVDTNFVTITDTTFITVTDTIHFTVTDTNRITVTDTLLIDILITEIEPPDSQNTLKIFPNPAHTQITIDNGNFLLMNGYFIKIYNGIGQTIFDQQINSQQFNIDLSTWGGAGLYFVHIVDDQQNIVDIRKIVLQ